MAAPFPAPVGEAGDRIGRLLIVDDDPSIRGLVRKVLKREGHAVDEADGVADALHCLKSSEIDVALIDLEMPEHNGLELLDAIRAESLTTVPVLLTGTTDVGAAVSGMKRGAFDYVAKPVNLDSLRWTVSRAVGAAHAHRRGKMLERIASDWTATFDACPELLMVIDAEGRILRANASVARLVQLPAEDLIGRGVTNLFPEDLGQAIMASRTATGEPGAAVKLFDAALGAHFLLNVNPIRTDGTAPGLIVVAHDVSEFVAMQAESARLFRRLITAEDDERARMARELHDGIGQSLVSISMGLSIVTQFPDAEGSRRRVEELSRLAVECLDECRRMAHGFHPAALGDHGLSAALTRLTQTFTSLHGIQAELILPGGPVDRLPNDVASSLYRIVQEALANVAKHSRAKTVDILLEAADRIIHVSISDDGVGFTAAATDPAEDGIGLCAMRDRALMFGGSFTVHSTPGQGTTIEVRVPFTEHAA